MDAPALLAELWSALSGPANMARALTIEGPVGGLRVARFLMDADETPIAEDRELTAQDAEPWLETGDSAWGPLARVRCPGRIDAVASGWSRTPGPLATDLPAW